jgi:UDP-MurNAc hydroxylase
MTGPVVRHLGHAGFVVEHAGRRLLIDPWFHPAFLGAWFPWPDNRFLRPEIAGGRFDLLYLSHTHEDHFDERLLATLDRDVTVVVPRFRSRDLPRRLTALGFADLVLLDHGGRHEVAPGFTLTMLLDTSHKEDSGLLVELDGFRFLDLNDCNPALSELPGDIDLLAAQFSGAMWYPNRYEYPAETQRRLTARVRGDLFDTLVRKVRMTGARAYLPSAGPACFLDPELAAFNDRATTIFPHWPDVADDFAAACPAVAVVRPAPGDTLTGLVPGRVPEVVRAGAGPGEDLGAYRERRRGEWDAWGDPAAGPVTEAELDAYFARLQSLNRRFLGDWRRDVVIVAGTRRLLVRLGAGAGEIVRPAGPGDERRAGYTLRVPDRVLREIVDGRTGWEEALLSMRITLARDPDVFDLTLMSLLRYGNHPAQTMRMVRERELGRTGETIERCGVRVQRFCPHAGEDLALADIADGVLECPRHHWKWDLATGECVAGGSVPLRVEPVPAPEPR